VRAVLAPVRRSRWTWRAPLFLAGSLALLSCGDQGLFPTTVDPGPDFNIADVVFDQNFYYCSVEPVLFSNRCGPGDSGKGDSAGGCHFSVTSFRLTDYTPRVAESCSGNVPGPIAPEARQNYQTAQARMKRDPDLAALLLRPTGGAVHPRVIFSSQSADADVIREWATRFSSQ
jgi:hypothetical protein